MRYERLLEMAGDAPVVDTALLRLAGDEPKALSVQLSRWVAAGRLVQLRRGVYLLPAGLRRHLASRERIANLLVTPSYLSLETALSLHGLIPERVPAATSVTTGRPAVFDTPIGSFRYRHVRLDFFLGFGEMTLGGEALLVARPEKALLDLFYLSAGEFTTARLAELRLQNVDGLDLDWSAETARRCGSPKLARAVARLRRLRETQREGEVEL
jgi:predicted transcriptional regulator of viral defense system